MTLTFVGGQVNDRKRVAFTALDGDVQVGFIIGSAALAKLDSCEGFSSETEILDAFRRNRPNVERVAALLYGSQYGSRPHEPRPYEITPDIIPDSWERLLG